MLFRRVRTKLDFNPPVAGLSGSQQLQSTILYGREPTRFKIDENWVGNVNRLRDGSQVVRISMAPRQRNILILIIVALAMEIPNGLAQANPQLSLSLVGQSGEYVTPAGRTTQLKMEILNIAPTDVYLHEGEAYFDPDLNGTWELSHSEALGNFHLGYLQSAIWTFNLTVPMVIQAVNATNGVPQVVLLIKITYLNISGSQGVEQGAFALGVPGATVAQQISVIWLVFAGTVLLVSITVVYRAEKRRRAR